MTQPSESEHTLILSHAQRHSVTDEEWRPLLAINLPLDQHELVDGASCPATRHTLQLQALSLSLSLLDKLGRKGRQHAANVIAYMKHIQTKTF